eukprot:CFRG3285T1
MIFGGILAFVEIAFYFYHQKKKTSLEKHCTAPPFPWNDGKFLDKFTSYIVEHPKRFFPGWFFGLESTSISKEEMIHFFAAGLCSKTLATLTNKEKVHITTLVESLCKKGLNVAPVSRAPGEVKYMAHTMEPLRVIHRPLLTYVWSHYVALLTQITLRIAGFHYRHNGALNYWYRQGSATIDTLDQDEELQRSKPFVFLHGLGLGLAPYLHFILQLVTHVNSRGSDLYVLEMPYVAMRIHSTVPSMNDKAKAIEAMLHADGYTSANFIGHSFGTLVLARICKICPTVITSVVFVDPICFLLFLPDVLKNFIYTSPTSLQDWTRYLLCSRELYTQHTLCRNFWWYQLTLFAHELPPNASVFLSENDNIIPTNAVKQYLREHSMHVKHLEVFSGADHGQFLANFTSQAAILEQALSEEAEGFVVTHEVVEGDEDCELGMIDTSTSTPPGTIPGGDIRAVTSSRTEETPEIAARNLHTRSEKQVQELTRTCTPPTITFTDLKRRRRSSHIVKYRISQTGRGSPGHTKSEIVIDGFEGKQHKQGMRDGRRKSTPGCVYMYSTRTTAGSKLGTFIPICHDSATKTGEMVYGMKDNMIADSDIRTVDEDVKEDKPPMINMGMSTSVAASQDEDESELTHLNTSEAPRMTPRITKRLPRQTSIISATPKIQESYCGEMCAFVLAGLVDGFCNLSSKVVVVLYFLFTLMYAFAEPHFATFGSVLTEVVDMYVFSHNLLTRLWIETTHTHKQRWASGSRTFSGWSLSHEDLTTSGYLNSSACAVGDESENIYNIQTSVLHEPTDTTRVFKNLKSNVAGEVDESRRISFDTFTMAHATGGD